MKMKKLILTNLPYVLFVYLFGKLAEAFRLAPGTGLSERILSIDEGFRQAFAFILPAFHPIDILVGIAGAVVVRLTVYFKSKNTKKFRPGTEYGAARWSA